MRLAIVSMVVMMVCFVASAKIYVPTDYATIQYALDSAKDGEEIVVKPGVYEENLLINKSVVLRAEKGALSTIIKAKNQSLPVIRAESLPDSEISVKIIGFTVKDGSVGISLERTKDCELTENSIEGNEVGIQLKFASFCNVHKNRVADNKIGVEVITSVRLHFWMNTFENNTKDVVSDRSTVVWFSKDEIEYEFNGNQKGYLGNFWDKNRCNDWNRDGVCEEPYHITSSDSDSDLYPLATRYGVDLAIKALQFDEILLGSDNRITVTISNLGGYVKVKNVLVSLYVIEQNKTSSIGRKTVVELSPQSEATVEFSWKPYVAKKYALKATVESRSADFNPKNNEFVISIDFQIPDLVLVNVSVPERIFIDESYDLAVEIANLGSIKAENFSLCLYLRSYYGDELISSERVSLDANETKIVYLSWKPTELGSLSLKVVLDPENEVTELNESNNYMTLRLKVESKEREQSYEPLETVKTQQQTSLRGKSTQTARLDTNVFLVIAVAFIALSVVSIYLARKR